MLNKKELNELLRKMGISQRAFKEMSIDLSAYFHMRGKALQLYALGELEDGKERSHIDGCDDCLKAVYILRCHPGRLKWDMVCDDLFSGEFMDRDVVFKIGGTMESIISKIGKFLFPSTRSEKMQRVDEIVAMMSEEEKQRILDLNSEIPGYIKIAVETELKEEI